MMMRLEPAMWLSTPKGQALAHIVIDRGIDHDVEWVCFIQATGECWTFLNSDVRAVDNITLGRVIKKGKRR